MNGLPALAQTLASQGRGGDSMMVHMSPEEVAGLRSLAMQQGTDLTINPVTGMPEAFKLKKLLRAVAPIIPFLPIPGVQALLPSLISKSVAAGIIGGIAAPGKGFNFREGLKTGLLAYGGGKLMESMQAGQVSGKGISATPGASGEGFKIDPSAGGVEIPSAMPSPAPTAADFSLAAGTSGAPSFQASNLAPIPANVGTPSPYNLTGTSTPVDFSLAPPPSTAMQSTAAVPSTISGKFEQAVGVSPSTAILGGTVGYGLLEGDAERRKFKAAEMAALQAQRDREDEYRRLFERTLGSVPMAAGGGLVALAGGGMPTFEYGGTTGPTNEPRMVKGAGDGMSDNVPASIEGVQEARLANDEFVIPADVVADIGNGSSSAGAKKLYAMMDRIREARHGTTEQPPEINAEKYLPA